MAVIDQIELPNGSVYDIGGGSSTDTKVTQTATSTNADYEILFSGTADNTTRTEEARKNDGLKYNPNQNALTVGGRTGVVGYSSLVVGSRSSGYYSTASGSQSVAFGSSAVASGSNSVANGLGVTASGSESHAEGIGTHAYGDASHAEGYQTTTGGNSGSGSNKPYSHAEGQNTTATGQGAHAEGGSVTASGDYSHAEGYGGNTASGNHSHVEGYGSNLSSGQASHAEGFGNVQATNTGSHAEGNSTTSSGSASHAEGSVTTASGAYSHAEGVGTAASGSQAHAEGNGTISGGSASHAEGTGSVANHKSQHVIGEYNVLDTNAADSIARGDYVEIVGNGTSASARSNARTLDWEGNEVLAGGLTLGNDITRSSGTWDGTNTSLEDALAGKSPTTHNHDSSYASISHNHDSSYASKSEAIKNITRSGTTFTATRTDNTTFTFTQRDNDTTTGTTYAAGSAPNNTTFGTNGSIKNVYDACLKLSGGTVTGTFKAKNIQTSDGSIDINNGGLEIYHATPFIDMHLNKGTSDFTYRMIHRTAGYLDFIGANSSTWGKLKAATYQVESSVHVKENIKDISETETLKLLELRPVSFDYKEEVGGTKNQRGLIAEEVLEVLPNCVDISENYTEFNPDEPWNAPSIDYSKFTPYLIKLCQIQQDKIDSLEERISKLESLINS